MAAIRNMHALVNRYIAPAVSPNFIGIWLASQGYAQVGDASITAAIVGTVLTVSAIASGALVVGSLLTDDVFELADGTMVTAFDTGQGGTGTYEVSPSQDVDSEQMTASGTGARASGYGVFPGLAMQVQAVSGPELQLTDALNLQETVRVVYMNGQVQGVQRPNAQGGDLLKIPTGLSGAPTANFTGAIADDILTVSAITSGAIVAGGNLGGQGIASGTAVLQQLTGNPGGAGTYQVTPGGQAVDSEALQQSGYDIWLVKAVLEGWDVDGWAKVLVVLQMPTQNQ
jgi:hypothetical protein